VFDQLSRLPNATKPNPHCNCFPCSANSVNNQEKANQLASGLVKSVAVHAFYTAMPQLISRITHRDVHTATVVRAILKRILTKFPAQAMWGLAWLRNSADKVRSKVGEDLFLGAEKNLRRLEHMKMHDLLVSSKSLFKYLIDLAS
jgi:serine/threonine-protein kinase ATR